jgi:hypothetical protein
MIRLIKAQRFGLQPKVHPSIVLGWRHDRCKWEAKMPVGPVGLSVKRGNVVLHFYILERLSDLKRSNRAILQHFLSFRLKIPGKSADILVVAKAIEYGGAHTKQTNVSS